MIENLILRDDSFGVVAVLARLDSGPGCPLYVKHYAWRWDSIFLEFFLEIWFRLAGNGFQKYG